MKHEKLEEWRAVVGYEGLYEVSNLGRVRSIDRIVGVNSPNKNMRCKGRLLKQQCFLGYLCVRMMRHRKGNYKGVHRIVAQAFIPNPENKPQVNHIDFNKENNRVTNLEWCTQFENNRHTVNHGRKYTILRKEDVLFIRSSPLKQKELAEMFKVHWRTIQEVQYKNLWKSI